MWAWVLGAALLVAVGVAACAFVMSFFSLRDFMVMLGLSTDRAWLWPIPVDLSLIGTTVALLYLTSPQVGGNLPHAPNGASVVSTPASGVIHSGPRSEAERRLWWESIAAVVQQQHQDVRKISELPTAKLAEILARLYDRGDSKRAICADHELHHREVRTITQTTSDVLARVTTHDTGQ